MIIVLCVIGVVISLYVAILSVLLLCRIAKNEQQLDELQKLLCDIKHSYNKENDK